MRKLFISFKQFIQQITKDLMLFVVCLAPVLVGFAIHFGIPLLEKILTNQFNKQEILLPYYLLFDLFLAIMTPMLFCYVSAMIILGEIDDKISNYIAVTPLGKSGYLISRLGFPCLISIFVTIILLFVFSLTHLSFLMILIISILTAIFGIIISMLIISLSTNKVEGMAVAKLSGLLMIGLPVPFFILSKIQYCLFFLPSFWIVKLAMEQNYFYFVPCLFVSVIWIYFLMKRFSQKLK